MSIQTDIKLHSQKWTPAEPINMTHLSVFEQANAPYVSQAITRTTGGDMGSNFPLTYATEGLGNVEEIEDGGINYRYRVIDDNEKTVPLKETVTEAYAGRGFKYFEMIFPEKHFSREHALVSPSGQRIRILEDPTPKNGGWMYQMQLLTGNPDEYVDPKDLKEGVHYVQSAAPVSNFGSRGTNTNFTAPYTIEGQITTVRKSYRYKGNMPKMIMTMQFPGVEGMYWMDVMEWEFRQKFLFECEDQYMYGKDNRDNNGVINNLDWNGQPIPIGDGIIAQVPNKYTYGSLSTNYLTNVVRDLFWNISLQAEIPVIELQTGSGGMRSFHRAVEANNSGFNFIDTNQVTAGADGSLSSGKYYREYRTIDNYILRVVHNPVFDRGYIARVQRKAKMMIDGAPLESHRLLFLDKSSYDGEPNMKMLAQKGRRSVRWMVAGGAPLPKGMSGNTDNIAKLAASEIDEAAVHELKTGQIFMKNGRTSIDMRLAVNDYLTY